MANTACANTYYLRKEDARMEAQDIFNERVDEVLDEWAKDSEKIIFEWDDILDAMKSAPKNLVDAFCKDDPIRFFELMQLEFRALMRDEAIEYVRDN